MGVFAPPKFLVMGSKLDAFPNGDAFVAWTTLKRKYRLTSAPNKTKLLGEFYATKMEDNEDPDLFIAKMERMRLQRLRLPSKNLINSRSHQLKSKLLLQLPLVLR